jgi:putative hydrolase of the HAD superfamily
MSWRCTRGDQVPVLWVTDADNTLWDTDAVYRSAQLALLADVERALGVTVKDTDRLRYVREADQALAAADHRGFRYPVSALVCALAERLGGNSLRDAVRAAVKCASPRSRTNEAVAEDYLARLADKPVLRRGVANGLATLMRMRAEVVVVTEGSKCRVEATLRHYGLDGAVRSVVQADKAGGIFERLALTARADSAMWAIGDQLQREVAPAVRAGFNAIHFPGGFVPPGEAGAASGLEYLTVDDYSAGVNAMTDRMRVA